MFINFHYLLHRFRPRIYTRVRSLPTDTQFVTCPRHPRGVYNVNHARITCQCFASGFRRFFYSIFTARQLLYMFKNNIYIYILWFQESLLLVSHPVGPETLSHTWFSIEPYGSRPRDSSVFFAKKMLRPQLRPDIRARPLIFFFPSFISVAHNTSQNATVINKRFLYFYGGGKKRPPRPETNRQFAFPLLYIYIYTPYRIHYDYYYK